MTVAALIECEGRFLMVQERISGKSVYNQPAGHLEDNETLTDAVIRETREETAWHFQPESVTGIYRWRHPEKDKTFIRITNKDIYKKLVDIEKHVMKTNGKVKLNSWVSRTALGLVILLIGIVVKLGR